jgi:basic membrane protein A
MEEIHMKKLLALVLSLCMLFTLASFASADDDDTIKIGMVTDVGGVNDKSFNQTSWEGLQALAAEDPTFKVNYLESKTDADYQTNIQTFIDEEYDLIICVGYMLADATREAATENPDQKFAIIDDASIDLPNVACLMFAQEQASYLVGLVAGYVTESKVVGYVQGMVSDSMNLFGIGYITGVKEACPEATVLQYNANNFGDIAGGGTAAKDMITKGADVIYHAAGGTGLGVINACDEAGIWAIGVDTDQSVNAPDHVITSAMKRVDTASQDISKAVKDGTFTPGVHLYDLTNGGVDLAPTRDHIPADVLEKVEAAKAAIIAGEKTVPTTVAECPDFTLGAE